MKISVVIPAHNEENVIASTLEAILNQDYPDFEVIIVDNASTDTTSGIVKEFQKKHTHLHLVYEPKKGLLQARESGRQKAQGEIIANMDADCLPEKDWLRRGSNFFTDNSIAATTGPYDYYDGAPSFRYMSFALQKYVYTFLNTATRIINGGGILIGGNNFIRATSLEKMGGYNTAIVFYGEDTDTARRVSHTGRIVFHPKLVMKTSARRFKEEGTFKIGLYYFFHFFKVAFFSRSTAIKVTQE